MPRITTLLSNGVTTHMIEQQTTELAVHDLLIRRMTDLGSDPDDGWARSVEQLCADLLQLDPEVDRTFAAAVRALIVLQDFLLEALAPEPGDRPQVLEMARWLLDNLHNEDRGPTPPQPPSSGVPIVRVTETLSCLD